MAAEKRDLMFCVCVCVCARNNLRQAEGLDGQSALKNM